MSEPSYSQKASTINNEDVLSANQSTRKDEVVSTSTSTTDNGVSCRPKQG